MWMSPLQVECFSTISDPLSLSHAVSDLPPNDTINAAIQICSKFVWELPTLGDVQKEVVGDISDPNKHRKRMVSAPTAIGKSHITGLMLTMHKGIHLIVHPLLELTVDQVNAFKGG